MGQNKKNKKNGYTTVEQSKKLLKLGLPYDSADMCWSPTYLNGKKDGYLSCPYVLDYPIDNIHETDALPCWSFHRLLSIVLWQDYDMQFFGCPMEEPMEYVYKFLIDKLKNNTFKRFNSITW